MKISEGVAELIGVLIGDGYIYNRNGKYQIGFVGSPLTDKEYYEKLQELILSEWEKQARIKLRERGIRIVINSKKICNFLINELGIQNGSEKCKRIKIPEKIRENWKLVRNTLRGIADTDGSVFAARKPGIEHYPSIEITTSSRVLAEQIREILSRKGFRVANIWQYKSKLSRRTTYKVPLNGKKNLKKWINEIGFSNPYKLNRATKYLKN